MMDQMRDRVQPTDARTTLVELLRPDVSAKQDVDGYLDLLGEHEAIGSGVSQRVFRGKALPRIYERFSRPVVAWLLFYGGRLSAAGERQLTLDLLNISPGESILDVGCGTGDFTRAFAKAADGVFVVGLDASKTMLSVAVENGGGENLAYVRADGCDLPFGDDEFDAVTTVGCIHLLTDPFKSLREMVRVARPGARIVIGSTWRRAEKGRWGKGGMVRFGCNELSDALEAQGCVDVSQQVYGKGQFVLARKR
jgi:SAM-dependent methyltransferase